VDIWTALDKGHFKRYFRINPRAV